MSKFIEVGDVTEVVDKYLTHKQGSDWELALLVKDLIENYGYEDKQNDIAKLLGISQSKVSRMLSLFKLIPELQKMLHDKKISYRASYYLSTLSEDDQRKFVRDEYIPIEEVEKFRRNLRVQSFDSSIFDAPECVDHVWVCAVCGKRMDDHGQV